MERPSGKSVHHYRFLLWFFFGSIHRISTFVSDAALLFTLASNEADGNKWKDFFFFWFCSSFRLGRMTLYVSSLHCGAGTGVLQPLRVCFCEEGESNSPGTLLFFFFSQRWLDNALVRELHFYSVRISLRVSMFSDLNYFIVMNKNLN